MKLILGVFLVIITTVTLSTLGVSLLVKRQNDQNSRLLVNRALNQTRRSIERLKNRTMERVANFAGNPTNLINMRYLSGVKGRKNVGAYTFILERPKEEMVLALADLAREEDFESFHVYDAGRDILLSLRRRGDLLDASFTTYDDDGNRIIKYGLLEKTAASENPWKQQPFIPDVMNHLSYPMPQRAELWFGNRQNEVILVGLIPFLPKRTPDNGNGGAPARKPEEPLGCILFHKVLGESFAEGLHRVLEMEVNIFAGRNLSFGTLKPFDVLPSDLWSLTRSPQPGRVDDLEVRVASYAGEEYYQAFVSLLEKSTFVGAVGLSLSRSDTQRKTRESILLLISVMGICILAAVPVTIYLAARVSARFGSLLDAVQRIRSGDLSAHAEVSSGDELGKLAGAFNQMTEDLRRHVEKLRESEEKYRNLFDFAPDGIMITTSEGEILSFNETTLRIFKYEDRDSFARLSARDFYVDPERDRTALTGRLTEDRWIENHEVLFKDREGRPFTAGLSLKLISYEGRIAIQTVMRDITRIKTMEAELRNYSANLERMVEAKTSELTEANEQLRAAYDQAGVVITKLEKTQQALERSNSELAAANKNLQETREQLARSAHQAGMAEIAVSVLHNIGNAINSVNIRTYSMERAAAYKEIGLLRKLREFLQSEEADRPGIPLDDELRKHLLQFIEAVIDSCEQSRDNLEVNARFIRNGLDHIMEIIALQQEYAGVRGAESPVDINHLLQDAVEMLRDSLNKRQITVHQDLKPLPQIVINKNKLMQVFINIVKNAYEAIDEAGDGGERKITVNTVVARGRGLDHVCVVISDTGIGLEPDIREKIFRFDYSTKGRGTGFGLHDAANYIHAQEGTIEIQSEGRGKGAQLVIRLPVSKPMKEIAKRAGMASSN